MAYLNVIGILLDILGVIILLLSSLSKELIPLVSKLFLKTANYWADNIKEKEKRFALDSKEWFFEGFLKSVLSYLGSENKEPKGYRVMLGTVLILLGFFFQLIYNLSNLFSFLCILFCLLVLYIIIYFIICCKSFKLYKKITIKKLNKNRVSFKRFYRPLSQTKKILFNVKYFVSYLIYANFLLFTTMILKSIYLMGKIIKWFFSVGISEEERIKNGNEALEEFYQKYGEEWDKISNKLFNSPKDSLNK